jgi:hypothetical protein
VLFFVGMAQEVVLVLSPEPTSLVDAYAVVKVLSQQAGIRNFAVVINPVVDEMPTTICGPPEPSVSSKRAGVSIRAGALPLRPLPSTACAAPCWTSCAGWITCRDDCAIALTIWSRHARS